MNWIQTYSGYAFNPLSPDPSAIVIEDIAHALSLTCRYNGHCRRFYSVAEHCVLLTDVVESKHKLEALLHDATEAYLSDVPGPIKPQLPGYKHTEQALETIIRKVFGLDGEVPADVKLADRRMLVTEARQVFTTCLDDWNLRLNVDPYDISLQYWSPEQAEREFLERYHLYAGM